MIYTLYRELDIFPLEAGKTSVYHRRTKKTYELGAKESKVLQCFNGVNTLQDIQAACPFFSAEELEKLTAAFRELAFFEEDQPKRRINPLKLRLRICNPNRVIRGDSKLTAVLNALILIGGPALFALGLLSMLLRWFGVLPAQTDQTQLLLQLSGLGVWDYIAVFGIGFVSLALHEFSHAITARRYGANVPEMGVMLYCLVPCAYTNISGIRLIESDRRKIAALLSGNCTNLGIAGICGLLLPFISNPLIAIYLCAALLINLATVLFNCIFVLQFDGYYILEILLDAPGFLEKAHTHLRQCIMLLFGKKNKEARAAMRQSLKSSDQAATEHLFYCVYALMSILFIPLIVSNTVLSFLI